MGKTRSSWPERIHDPFKKYGVNRVTVHRRGSVKSRCNRSSCRGPPRCFFRATVFGGRPRPSSKLEPSSSSQDKPVLEDDSDSHSLLVKCSSSEKGIAKLSFDSDSHSHLTKCSSSSTVGGEKEITNNTSSDSEPHSHLTKCSSSSTIGGEKGTSSDSTGKSVVKDRKKGKKRKKSGGDGSEERKGKKTKKKKSLLVTE
ncbi:hypothetical protein TSUD_202140 [Trifolium subterraneum]|uniref:Uncharacterized protein n=1 Tax=Trifolium subterraneum TaxID=3900 RepID=A0A2Z6MQ39_TRISU|nr:hypothetical protein TSUD_202140 [Trifolium subterraneum]